MKTIASLVCVAALASTAEAAVVANGEIVIIEGDAATVAGGPGAYYIDSPNIDAIVTAFLGAYPDEFDMLMIHTSFPDMANGGAYFTSAPPISQKMIGFVNMNQVGFWGSGGEPLAVMGQEFTHAWLAFESFFDQTLMMVSDEMLGRDAAHWSALLDAEGSVQDGVDWTDNGDGTFTAGGIMTKLSPLDLYVMGYYDADEVPPFFLMRGATTTGGTPVGPLGIWDGSVGPGTVVTATKVPITIQDVIMATGPLPPPDMRQKDYRVAIVIVTEPGQTAATVAGLVPGLDATRLLWNDVYTEWTMGRGTMCTDVSAPCDIPRAAFVGGRVTEGAESDADGIVEPGEHANVEVDWRNTGNSPADGAIASLTASDPMIVAPAPVPIGSIGVGAVQTSVFDILVPDTIACGDEYVFHATAALGLREWSGDVYMIPGIVEGAVEQFATDGGWRGNLAGADTVPEDNGGAWEYGPAEESMKDGMILQPAGGRSGAGDSAWWTGRDVGFDFNIGDVDTGVTTLTTAPYDVKGRLSPQLRYHVWYQAWTFNTVPPQLTTGDDLVVEVSADDGVTWTEIDRVGGTARTWERRDIPFEQAIPAGTETVIFRFTAQDAPPAQNLVEVGIDDVSIWNLSPSCGGGGGEGCGCETPGQSGKPMGGLVVGLLFAAALLVTRRRR